MRKISLFAALLSFFGCKQPATHPAFPIREYSRLTDEGFEDIRLSVAAIERSPTHTIVTELSTIKGDSIGLVVCISTEPTDGRGFGEGLVLQRYGVASDRLVQLLGELYRVPVPVDARFADSIVVNYVDLDAFALAVAGSNNKQADLFKSKLFLENEEGELGEFYLNVHFGEHWLEIKEKEDSFRESMIQLLQGR